MKSKSMELIEGHFQKIAIHIGNLTPAARAELWREIQSLNNTNCWWVMFQAQRLLTEMVEMATPKGEKQND